MKTYVRHISFAGYDFDANTVVAIDPVDSHRTGNLSCDWKYGIKIRLTGAKIVVICPTDLSNSATREKSMRNAEETRQRLVRLVWQY